MSLALHTGDVEAAARRVAWQREDFPRLDHVEANKASMVASRSFARCLPAGRNSVAEAASFAPSRRARRQTVRRWCGNTSGCEDSGFSA
jgi:hypothetical protein